MVVMFENQELLKGYSMYHMDLMNFIKAQISEKVNKNQFIENLDSFLDEKQKNIYKNIQYFHED